jgi:hypothetical protein
MSLMQDYDKEEIVEKPSAKFPHGDHAVQEVSGDISPTGLEKASSNVKTTPDGIVLVPQPTDDPDEPLVSGNGRQSELFLTLILELAFLEEACSTCCPGFWLVLRKVHRNDSRFCLKHSRKAIPYDSSTCHVHSFCLVSSSRSSPFRLDSIVTKVWATANSAHRHNTCDCVCHSGCDFPNLQASCCNSRSHGPLG